MRPLSAFNNGRPNDTATGAEANNVLDAFFLGKAFADTVNERLGAALGDLLSEISKRNAERDYAIRSFQQEVQQRADREKEQRTGLSLGSARPAPASYSPSSPAAANGSVNSVLVPDVQEIADELRAEVAATKATLQQVRLLRQTPTLAP